ncbi:ABC transporter permease [Salinarimonas rosea]|uniref:ABC transporter permease n=1 Tax=Salinarimonas rosea TaxID=552063 RepID=UPI0003FE8930|nr:ABC transporter permease [Salinarimonas rosea]
MVLFIVRRALQAGLVLLAVSLVVFTGLYAVGDPADILLPDDATAAEREAAIVALGLDRPIWTQYGIFLANALQGDLGTSFVFNIPSITLIFQRMPATLELALCAMLIALVIGVPLGLYAGLKPGSRADSAIVTGSILGFSLPNFWQGLMLILVFSIFLGWLPSSGRGETGTILGIETSLATWDGIRHLILPATNLALFKVALMIRLTRAQVRETMPLDFVKFARAKGMGESRIVGLHVGKTIAAPIVTVLGMELGSVIAFAVITESIFAWPGMGKLIIDSINNLDRPVVAAYLLVVTFLFIVINLVVDVLYSLLDPRVRLGRRA